MEETGGTQDIEGALVEVERPQVGWRFWLLWVAATNAGFFPGIFVGLRLGDNVAHALGGPMDSAVTGVGTGASVGITQWLVLRAQVARSGW